MEREIFTFYQNNKISSKLKHYDGLIREAIKAGMKEKDIRGCLGGNSDMEIFLKYLTMDHRMLIEAGDRPEPETEKKTELSNILDEFNF